MVFGYRFCVDKVTHTSVNGFTFHIFVTTFEQSFCHVIFCPYFWKSLKMVKFEHPALRTSKHLCVRVFDFFVKFSENFGHCAFFLSSAARENNETKRLVTLSSNFCVSEVCTGGFSNEKSEISVQFRRNKEDMLKINTFAFFFFLWTKIRSSTQWSKNVFTAESQFFKSSISMKCFFYETRTLWNSENPKYYSFQIITSATR